MNKEPIRKSNILSISHKFAKNSIYNVMGFIVTFPILILLIPYMLGVLGKVQFGIWAIAGVVTSYAQLSDMGMTTAIVKFVAEHWAKKEVDRISGVVSTAFFSFAVVGGAVAIGILLARHFIVINLLKVPPDMQSEAIFVVSGIVVIFYFNLLFSVYNSVLMGLQRMDVTNAIMVVSKVLRAIGMWFFLALGFGLKGLIINGALFSFLTAIFNAFWARRLTGRLRVNPSAFSFLKLKQIFSYSINVFIARIIALGQDPINKIILAWYGSLYFVSFYEIGWRVNMMVRQLFSIGITPLLPVSSELDSLRDSEELKKIYLSVSRLFYLFATPIFLVVIILADPLVQVWLGDGYKLAAIAIQFLLLGNFFSLLVTPQYFILLGIGKPQINTIAHALGAGINVILAIVLVYYIGFYGVLVGGLISFLVSSLYIDFQFRRITKIELRKYIRQVPGYAILASLISAGSLAYATAFVRNWHFAKIIGFALGCLLLYLAVLKFTGALNNADKQNMISLIKSLQLS